MTRKLFSDVVVEQVISDVLKQCKLKSRRQLFTSNDNLYFYARREVYCRLYYDHGYAPHLIARINNDKPEEVYYWIKHHHYIAFQGWRTQKSHK